ncbi:MAG: GNAT family N-acetyltransferase [bacterium]|nr:GNAT family N-acetyltransferase [bacterium]
MARGLRFSINGGGKEIARAYLYVLKNDLHDTPFGLLEDVFVDETHRGTGTGRELLDAVIARARTEKCYKLIATSRDDGTRKVVHDWYLRLGFCDYGSEFRIDL